MFNLGQEMIVKATRPVKIGDEIAVASWEDAGNVVCIGKVKEIILEGGKADFLVVEVIA